MPYRRPQSRSRPQDETVNVHTESVGRGTGIKLTARSLTQKRTEVVLVLGEILAGLLLHLLVVRQPTDRVVHEESDVLTPLLEERFACLRSVQRLDRRGQVLRVLVESPAAALNCAESGSLVRTACSTAIPRGTRGC